MANVRIEKARREDVPLIVSFIRELAEYERMSDQVVVTEDRLREFLFGPQPCAEVLIAWDDGAPAGFALFFHNLSTFLAKPGIYLEDLFVRPSARGKGIGRGLLACLARLALARGCGRVEWSVLNWNDPAIRFYKSLGAVPQDDWTVYRVSGEALERLAKELE